MYLVNDASNAFWTSGQKSNDDYGDTTIRYEWRSTSEPMRVKAPPFSEVYDHKHKSDILASKNFEESCVGLEHVIHSRVVRMTSNEARGLMP